MKPLQKNQGRTDHILGAMADMLSSLAMPSQHWNTESSEELQMDGEQKASSQSQWDQERLEWEQASRDSPERGQRDKEGSSFRQLNLSTEQTRVYSVTDAKRHICRAAFC
ncbi:rho guanine nucleotide exchange factor 25 isoform X1 [Silurus asotus]|uniref:Rho guanine nucleotide exchange factor 25 isoform X1 n=1 Tax=Silurus asotus TaxID=30991 RepID=A0AAD5AAP4_SILAS|nr:rho guanine nucleotide exchange factor 25 isoform X1 [Silurus asotus]